MGTEYVGTHNGRIYFAALKTDEEVELSRLSIVVSPSRLGEKRGGAVWLLVAAYIRATNSTEYIVNTTLLKFTYSRQISQELYLHLGIDDQSWFEKKDYRVV